MKRVLQQRTYTMIVNQVRNLTEMFRDDKYFIQYIVTFIGINKKKRVYSLYMFLFECFFFNYMFIVGIQCQIKNVNL